MARFNKSDTDAVLSVQLPPRYTGNNASVMRLTAPAIDAATEVKLGGAKVAKDGTWAPVTKETAISDKGLLRLKIPAYSAASASFV
jgi:hypothetical protein